MVRYVLNLILAVLRDMKLMMTLNLCMIIVKKILVITCIYGSLKQPTRKNVLWRTTILFISYIMG